MKCLRLISLSSRTATLLITPAGTRYRLPDAIHWQLRDADERTVATGSTDVAPLFFDSLSPSSDYRLHCDLGELTFRTSDCAGLIRAADHGVSAAAADNATAMNEAIRATPAGGMLQLPEGRLHSGPLFLKPAMTLHLPSGCELAAIGERRQWPILPAHDERGRVIGTWEGLPEASHAALLNGIDCNGLQITGAGIIDGGGDRADWWQWPKQTRNGARRPRTIFLAYSHDVTLSGLTVCNSPSWTIHPYRCSRFTAAALTIRNPPDSPNTDGLNPESCEQLSLSGLHFSVGDDCIAIKAGKRQPACNDHLHPTRDVRITHCHMQRGHGAVVLGSEMSGDISDISIAHCDFIGTDRGLRIKTRRGRGGRVSRVRLRDVHMQDVLTPLACNAFYFCDPDGRSDAVQSRDRAPVDETTPSISDINLSNVIAERVSLAVAALLGLPESPIRGVTLDDLSVSYDPSAIADVPLMALGVSAVRHAGILATHAEVQGEIHPLSTNRESERC